MALPTNRKEFKDYVLRRLGYPVMEINVDDGQVEDRIDDALQMFVDYHYSGTIRMYLKHQITQEDKDNEFIQVPDWVLQVVGIFDLNVTSIAGSLFGIRYQMALNDMFNLSYQTLVPYWIAMRHVEQLEEFFAGRPQIRFNQHMGKLYLDCDWKNEIQLGQMVIIDCYRALDPEEFKKVWKDRWLLRYATALVKRQYGEHLIKFNMVLPGPANVTYNGSMIYDAAVKEIEELEQNLIRDYSMPIPDMIG